VFKRGSALFLFFFPLSFKKERGTQGGEVETTLIEAQIPKRYTIQ
jgi:hypothetical protein